jgi:hypothetical protein
MGAITIFWFLKPAREWLLSWQIIQIVCFQHILNLLTRIRPQERPAPLQKTYEAYDSALGHDEHPRLSQRK